MLPRLPVVLASAFGCVEGPGGERPVPDADFELFVADVQPVFDDRCGERTCHGTDDRPLGLFSPGRQRRDPDRVDLEAPLEDEELRANFDRSRAFLVLLEAPTECELLTKPLSVQVGGVGHAAGAVFASEIDDQYLDILDWVSDAVTEGQG